MLKLVFGLLLLATSAIADARGVRVRGYYRKDGTYVQPHVRSSPNSTTADNWSTQGNFNPYTGEEGKKDPAPQQRSYPMYPSYVPPAAQPYPSFQTQRPAPAPMPLSYNIQDPDTFMDVCGGNYRDGADRLGMGACTGFIGGIVEFDRSSAVRTICMPDGTDLDGVVDWVARHIRRDTEDASSPTVYSAWRAMVAAYPCGDEAQHSGK